MNNYALILAGGSGTRFWPLSRNSRPKQLLNLLEDTSMLQQAVNRLQGLVDQDKIFILTNELQLEEVRNQLPGIPQDHIIAEPCRRDTAPAIALGIGLIASRDPEACMMVIPSDQLIRDEASFRGLMKEALMMASREPVLITVGIKPTWPCPSYGYIETGEQATAPFLTKTCRTVKQFREKPDEETARDYLARGGFLWNAGMFVWSVPTIRQELARHCPQLATFIASLTTASSKERLIQAQFPGLVPISIDFALMEKAEHVLTFEAAFDWDDVGSWISVASYLPQKTGNATNAPIIPRNSSGNIVFTTDKGKTVALLGVKDLIVVDTGDAILVANKHQADSIKKIVEQLPQQLL